MLNKVKKIIVCAFALVLCIMNVGQVNVLANTDDINEELKGYDLTACENAKTSSLITFSELGFGTDDYSLIAYVYNYDKKPLNLNTGSNVINMACRFIVDDKTNEYVPVEYSNFNLKYLSKTSDNLIYKFSVVDKDKILKNLFTYQNAIYGERTYAITGIQLIDIYSNLAKDYNVGRKFIYSGYENDKTLKHSLKTVETIELKVNYVWYRTDSSSKGKNYQNQLNSVYFSVPNRYFDEGYDLTGIKAEWYEYTTQPIVVLENQEKYNAFKPYVGVDIGVYNENIKYSLSYGFKAYSAYDTYYSAYDWVYNLKGINIGQYLTIVSSRSTMLSYLFSTNGQAYSNYNISSEKLTNYIYNYNKSAVNGYLPIKNGNVSADLFIDKVDDGRTKGYNEVIIRADDTFNLTSYKENHGWWDTVFDYGLFNTLFGNIPTDNSIVEVKPIYEVKASDVKNIDNIQNKLLIDSSFVTDFYKFYASNSYKSKTFLFRFANTGYKSIPLDSNDGYVAQETVFLDFDIIHLEFSNGNNTIVYPVVSSPIDGVADGTPPKDFSNNYSYVWLIYAGIGVLLAIVGIAVYRNKKGV